MGKSGDNKGGALPFKLAKNDLIAELKLSHNVGGVSKLRSEQQKMHEEQERAEYRRFLAQFTMENFLEKIPQQDPNGGEIPLWKREMIAKKAAEKAKKEAIEKRHQKKNGPKKKKKKKKKK